MRTYVRLAITTLIAAATLATLVSTAPAGRLSVSNQNIRVVWSAVEFSGNGLTVRCRLTLEGSFHTRTITKVVRSLIGYITRAIFDNANCTNGRLYAYNGTERQGETTLANTLPWHLTYEGFGGSLPNITELRYLLTGARFLIEASGIRCIYTTGARGNRSMTGVRNLATGVVDWLVLSGSITPDAGSSFLCPNPGRFGSRSEDGLLTLLGTTTRITITLI